MNKKWFISYKLVTKDMLEENISFKYLNVITDISPARWVLESQYNLGGERVILYAEEIPDSLAVELSHGGCGIPTTYYNSHV